MTETVAAIGGPVEVTFTLEMPQTELFWALLQDGHPLEDLQKLNLEGFDWCERRGGKTLLVACIGKALHDKKETETDEQALSTIEWLIWSGALSNNALAKKLGGKRSQM